MSRDALLYLEDIQTSCIKVIRYVEGYTFESFLRDEKTFDAVVRNLEIVGEAAKHLPNDLTERYPEVAWRQIAGLRDFLAHVYFAIDLEVLWNVVTVEVPELLSSVRNILEVEKDALGER